jgi:hypothetical protein
VENAANLGDFETLASGVDVEGLTSSVGELCGDLIAGGHAAVPSDQPAMRSTNRATRAATPASSTSRHDRYSPSRTAPHHDGHGLGTKAAGHRRSKQRTGRPSGDSGGAQARSYRVAAPAETPVTNGEAPQT